MEPIKFSKIFLKARIELPASSSNESLASHSSLTRATDQPIAYITSHSSSDESEEEEVVNTI